MAKKNAKIEMPIDQRETFVSLQAKLGESNLSIEEKLKTLYELQVADSELDKIHQLRGELPLDVAKLEEDIAELKVKSKEMSAIIDEYNKGIVSNKMRLAESQSQIEKYRAQLENIANSREYDSLMKELENEEVLKKIADKNILEFKNKIAYSKQDLEEIKYRTSIKNEALKAKKVELTTIIEATSADEAKLQANREKCAEKIDERTMSAYERIRLSNSNKLAVVSIYNSNSCGGCFSIITPQKLVDIASNKKMIICEYCGRILVNSEFED